MRLDFPDLPEYKSIPVRIKPCKAPSRISVSKKGEKKDIKFARIFEQ
jgi:hypothetical protein